MADAANIVDTMQQCHDRAYKLLLDGVKAEEQGKNAEALPLYREGADILEFALTLQAPSQPNPRFGQLRTRMERHFDMATERMAEITMKTTAAELTAASGPYQQNDPGFLERMQTALFGVPSSTSPTAAAGGSGPAPRSQFNQLPPSMRPTPTPKLSYVPAAKPTATAPAARGAGAPPSATTPRGGATAAAGGAAGRGAGAAAGAAGGKAAPAAGPEPIKGVEPKMQQMILDEIVDRAPGVSWDDIAGLQVAKQALMEMVIQPALRPDLFTGLRSPPRGLLLFGPPGNGKTMLAKAVASEARASFFSISASSLTSKYMGESEKMVRALFAVARYLQPSIIFMDEIDSLVSERKADEHEATRRLKTEFLIQFDGVASGGSEHVIVMGATNRPEDIDEAARRRFTKRIYIPLPDDEARLAMLTHVMSKDRHATQMTEAQYRKVSKKAEGYSGADLASLCKEAAMMPLRELGSNVASVDLANVRPIELADFEKALKVVRPSVGQASLAAFQRWNNEFGSGGL